MADRSTDHEHPPRVDTSLARLESSIDQILETLSAVVRRQDEDRVRSDQKFERLVTDIRKDFGRVYERMERDGKTPWAPVAVGASIILAIAGAFGSQYARDLSRVEATGNELGRTVVERIRLAEYQRGLADNEASHVEDRFEAIGKWMEHQRDETDDRTELVDSQMHDILQRLSKSEERSRLWETILNDSLRGK